MIVFLLFTFHCNKQGTAIGSFSTTAMAPFIKCYSLEQSVKCYCQLYLCTHCGSVGAEGVTPHAGKNVYIPRIMCFNSFWFVKSNTMLDAINVAISFRSTQWQVTRVLNPIKHVWDAHLSFLYTTMTGERPKQFNPFFNDYYGVNLALTAEALI